MKGKGLRNAAFGILMVSLLTSCGMESAAPRAEDAEAPRAAAPIEPDLAPPMAGAPGPVEPPLDGSGSTFAIFDPEVPGPEHGPLALRQSRAATPITEGR